MTTKQQQAKLEARLRDGFEKIGRAMQDGLQVENWERHWIELLREYEAVSDELAAAVLEQASMPGMPRQEVANAA